MLLLPSSRWSEQRLLFWKICCSRACVQILSLFLKGTFIKLLKRNLQLMSREPQFLQGITCFKYSDQSSQRIAYPPVELIIISHQWEAGKTHLPTCASWMGVLLLVPIGFQPRWCFPLSTRWLRSLRLPGTHLGDRDIFFPLKKPVRPRRTEWVGQTCVVNTKTHLFAIAPLRRKRRLNRCKLWRSDIVDG